MFQYYIFGVQNNVTVLPVKMVFLRHYSGSKNVIITIKSIDILVYWCDIAWTTF